MEELFARLAQEEFERIPVQVRARMQNVALLIEDEPDAVVRAEEGLGEHETLLGLYRGVPMTARGEGYSGVLPDTITLYRVPLAEEAQAFLEEGSAKSEEEALRRAIRETLWHEIGHSFGLSELAVHAREGAGTNVFKETPAAPAPLPLLNVAGYTLGATLALLGLIGFANNTFVGSGALFAAGPLQSGIWLIFGSTLLFVALRTREGAKTAFKIFGVFLFLLGLLSILFVPSSGGALFGFIITNGISGWFNGVTGAVMVWLGMRKD